MCQVERNRRKGNTHRETFVVGVCVCVGGGEGKRYEREGRLGTFIMDIKYKRRKRRKIKSVCPCVLVVGKGREMKEKGPLGTFIERKRQKEEEEGERQRVCVCVCVLVMQNGKDEREGHTRHIY
jgi:hypothetical protein